MIRKKHNPEHDRIRPYRILTDGFDVEFLKAVHDSSKISLNSCGVLADFHEYGEMLDSVRAIRDARIVPLKDLFARSGGERLRIALRYDVDMNPCTALRIARFNARYGVCGSFFLLHTALYYGMNRSDGFVRNPMLSDWIRGLALAGQEVGLHIDPLAVYFEHEIDGLQAVKTEIEWIRSLGVPVHGAAAHNSYPVYGAENFEIFREFVTGRRLWIKHDRVRCPLGTVGLRDLALAYEANYPQPIPVQRRWLAGLRGRKWKRDSRPDAVNDSNWMRTYLLDNPAYDRGFGMRIWYHGPNQWTVADASPTTASPWRWKVGLGAMLDSLASANPGTTAVLHLHPIYFSADTSLDYMKNGSEPAIANGDGG